MRRAQYQIPQFDYSEVYLREEGVGFEPTYIRSAGGRVAAPPPLRTIIQIRRLGYKGLVSALLGYFGVLSVNFNRFLHCSQWC